ncbi:MAG: bifunctional [glutamate--ammonia ligase]-adenylyl-L-tyrosine phosphorylase/[glutamate--ammonia-ligase] adenylyltransferase [Steroidobacteraceae bacterium]
MATAETLASRLSGAQLALLTDADPLCASSLARALPSSDFICESLQRDGDLLADLLRGPLLARERSQPALAETRMSVAEALACTDDEFMDWLRRWRRREMVRIAWRDLGALADLDETLTDTSGFADAAIEIAYRKAYQYCCQRHGTPRIAGSEAQPLIVLAMGKLGGGELNFSSDIDLVFLFPEYGETDHPTRPVSHDEFFIRLGQLLIRYLSQPTTEGIVFRVDMRLRPFGDSGPLACGFSAFEDYLVSHGRDWERYAYVKARAITGQDYFADLYGNTLRPFVYRRYLDYGVFESLRDMKLQIQRQVERRDLAQHVKLGPGGIREIEFIVQAMQLIRGGQDPELQRPSLLQTLPLLAGSRLLPQDVVQELQGAYVFLRKLENRLQMWRDEQTHTLPESDEGQERIARAMGHASAAELHAQLEHWRGIVGGHFNALLFGPERQRSPDLPRADLGPLWDANAAAATVQAALEPSRLAGSAEAAQLLLDFRSGNLVRRLDQTGFRRLQRLISNCLHDLPDEHAVTVLRRLLRIIEAIGVRSSYFALLNENEGARSRLISICQSGDFLTGQIAAHPLLLDELIDARLFESVPQRAELVADLERRLQRADREDPEREIEALCEFKRAAVFRIGAADVQNRMPLMRVSDRLTDVAELLVEAAMGLAWQQITAQLGVPRCTDAGHARGVAVAALGYGKLGGMELSYASDLDLVFVHDSRGEQQETQGRRSVDNQVFFVRLAQRIVHILTVHTRAGRLYEVDMRLRPSGKGGMLVTSIDAFREYQRSEAWTWEHQALLHARAVAGAPHLRAALETLRLDVLQHDVRRDTLRAEVRNMRERMRSELSRGSAAQFDLKQDRGGIADIEFLAQYFALRWAAEQPPVIMYSDTIRQLESVASGNLVAQETVDVLVACYRRFRTVVHHRALDDLPALVPAEEFTAERNAVAAVWTATMDDPL